MKSYAAVALLWLTSSSLTAAFAPPVKKNGALPTRSEATLLHAAVKEKIMGAKTAGLLLNHRFVTDSLSEVAPGMSETERLRFALQFGERREAARAARKALAWRAGPGRAIVESAAEAVAKATEGGGWDNAPVYAAAPHADVINRYITPKSVLTMSTDEGDLIYVIRASAIDDKALMDRASVDQVVDYFLYAKEVHSIVANRRSERTGRLSNVIFANDISGVRKAPDRRFSKALTSSSDQYENLYPALAGPTMILNLPFVLQAFVGLLKPLFPKSVQERLVFTRAPVLAGLKELTPLSNNMNTKAKFVREVKGLLPK